MVTSGLLGKSTFVSEELSSTVRVLGGIPLTLIALVAPRFAVQHAMFAISTYNRGGCSNMMARLGGKLVGKSQIMTWNE